jgi:mono/diheme cytochrome c family protein
MRTKIAAAALGGLLFALVTTPVRAEPPQKLYELNCWGCHGAKGEGVKDTAPTLVGVAKFLKAPGGRAYLIEVPGVSYSKLSDADVAAVMNWVLGNFSKQNLPAGFTPYTAAEVKQYRKIHLPRLAETRKYLLKEIAAESTGD